MDQRKMNSNSWDDSVYGTGPTQPPKDRGGIIALLLVLVIMLCGIITVLGIMNIKLFQKLHSLVLTALTTIMLIKWYGVPRRNYHYWFSKIMLPVLKCIPWCVFHGVFNFCAKFYRYKKNAKWLIDSVGKKVYADPLPNEGLDEVVYVDFEGIKAPIPADPVPYLTYAYGPNYMELPPLSQRRCPHNFARIDLGKYVFDAKGQKPFRKVDVRGELFEEIDEE